MEEWEGLVQMDCLQRAAVPLACFTSPLSAALIFPTYRRERRGEEDWAVGADKLCEVWRRENVLYLNNKSSFSRTAFYSISSDTICNVDHIPGNCL